MLLSMLARDVILDLRRAQHDGRDRLIDGDRLTEEGIAWLTAQAEIQSINTALELKVLANDLGVRADWHEPDEQYVNARIIGNHLDNAMGSTTRTLPSDDPTNPSGEFNIILSQSGRDVAVINLATLLSWACGYERS